MKSIQIIALLIFPLSFSIAAYSQLWEQYSDSAYKFYEQKQTNKAIEYYFKAREELKKDSEETISYARICSNLGLLYKRTEQYSMAEPFYAEALKIRGKILGKEDPLYASSCTNLADLYFNMGQYANAEPLFAEARNVWGKAVGRTHPDYISSCNNLAVLYVKMSQYKKAEPLYIEAKNLSEQSLGKNNPDYAFSCNSVGILYEAMGLYEKAEPFLIEAKDIREKVVGKDHYDYAVSCNNLAIIYKEKRQIEKAEPLFVEAKNIIEKVRGKEHPDYAAICDGLAGLYSAFDQYKKAEPLYIEAKNIRAKTLGRDHPDYGKTCLNLAILYERTGQYEKAELLSVEAINLIVKALGKENLLYVGTSNSLAILYQKMGQYEKAELLYTEVKNITEKILGKEYPDYASSCNNLAVLYHKMGQYTKAEPLYEEAKQIREKVHGKEHVEYAESCNNLANLYLDMGQYEKAEPLFLETKKITEMTLGKGHLDYAGNCYNLAHLYYVMGQYEKAMSLCLESKQTRENILGKEHLEYAENCNGIALLYKDMGQYEKAEPLFLEAKNIKEKVLGKEHPDYALSCDNLATLYLALGQYGKAEPLYLEANEIIEKKLGKEHPEYASSCNNLANLYKDMGQYEKAGSLYENARQIWGKTLGKDHTNYAGCCNNLGFLYWNLKDYNKAHDFFTEAFIRQYNGIKKIFQFTSEAEKQSYLKNITDLGRNSFSFNTTSWPPSRQGFTYDVSLSNRNMILSSSQQLRSAINNTNDTSIRKEYSDWMSSREQLSYWYSKPIVERPVYVKDVEERVNTLEKELTTHSAEFRKAQAQKEIDWKAIQQNLKTNEAAIEFVEFKYHNSLRMTDSACYIALILRNDKPEPELVSLFEKRQLDKLFINPENQSTEDRINALYNGERALYNLIWEPVEKYFNGISKIYFASAGSLFKISLAALSINEKQVLGDKYQLIQLNTTATVTDNSQIILTATDKIQLYGGIRYDADPATLKKAVSPYHSSTTPARSLPEDLVRSGGFQFLPGTQQEAEEINKQAIIAKMPVYILNGTNATEESIKALAGNASPSVLHIATHGFFFPDPKDDKRDSIQRKFETSGKVFKQSDNPLFRAGLLFAGANNAWEGKPIEGIEDGILTAYEVSNLYLPNTKLVVLSACETALGDIQGSEGVYGLQRAFKMAGVQNLVMSLWKVPDAETSEFMQIFYKNLFARQTISNAFYNAQQVMKNKYRAEPYKWAAWVLVR